MNTVVLITWTITSLASGIVRSIAFFPASAVGDEIGNYAIASAGTIVEPNTIDDATNMNTATESICPKGWTLPTMKQIDNNRDLTNFSLVLGGSYVNGTLVNEATYGRWWGSEAYSGARRYNLVYNGSSLSTYNSNRSSALYVRCVSEEKTVTDLTYLQDMTGEIADNTLDGTTANSPLTIWLPTALAEKMLRKFARG